MASHRHNVESSATIEITSWGGEWIQIYDRADEHGIIILIEEIDDVIAALQEAKEVQTRPERQREELKKLAKWNQGDFSNDDQPASAGRR